MVQSLSSRLRVLSLAFLLTTLAGTQVLQAASFAVFKGQYGGKYTGVLAEASGATGRAIADAQTTVAASRKSAKFTITGTLNGVGYTQVIVLKKGRATLSTMIPGGAGDLAKSVTGTCKVRGKTAIIKAVNPGGVDGTLQVKIGFTTGGSTLIISTVVSLGGDPVYSTVIGA